VCVGNTGLPTGDGKLSDAFLSWQKFSRESPVFPIGNIVNGGTLKELTAEEIAAYDAPFPDDTYKAGARIFPSGASQPPSFCHAIRATSPCDWANASAAALRGGGFFGSAGSTNPMRSGVWAAAAHTVARANTRLDRVFMTAWRLERMVGFMI
jgi:hypothetical protein